MIIGKIKKDYPFIYNRILENLDEEERANLNEKDSILGAFEWGKTKEGVEVWKEIYQKGNTKPFYEFHKSNNNLVFKSL